MWIENYLRAPLYEFLAGGKKMVWNLDILDTNFTSISRIVSGAEVVACMGEKKYVCGVWWQKTTRLRWEGYIKVDLK